MIDTESQRRLLAGYWYDAVAAVLDQDQPGAVEAHRFCEVAKRILDLDAEDFAQIASSFDRPWASRLAAASFPLEPLALQRGALGTLVPLYELMLEVLELRAVRREPMLIVVTTHLIGEYLCQLAWETRLGHAGDPLRLPHDVGERWGSDDAKCAHPSALRATAKRAMNACNGDIDAYTAYLDKFHSRQGEALAVCAMNHKTVGSGQRPEVGQTCPNPCTWALRGTLDERADLDARCRLALLYVDSPLVALRHHAPVGHFFGVPSVDEISDAWLRTWERVCAPWKDGMNPLTRGHELGAPEPNEALPGMSALISAIAGKTIGPGHLIRDVGADIAAALGVHV